MLPKEPNYSFTVGAIIPNITLKMPQRKVFTPN